MTIGSSKVGIERIGESYWYLGTEIEFERWSCRQSVALEDGYRLEDFFDENGVYLGPDLYGVFPVFREA